MLNLSRYARSLPFVFLLIPPFNANASPQVGFTAGVPVSTQHNDNQRTGAYLNEKRITVASLKTKGMTRRFEVQVGSGVETQVLYLPSVPVKRLADRQPVSYSLAYVTTLDNKVVAVDVNSGQTLWSATLTKTTTPGGIRATPVIDAANFIIYVLYRTNSFCTNNPACNQQPATVAFRIAALDVGTGKLLRDQPIPATLNTVFGSIPFIASAQASRPGLLLNSFGLYVAFGAMVEDVDPYRGWLIKINPATLQVESAFTTSPNHQGHSAAGLWQSGGGIACDSFGNIYIATGNGAPDLYYGNNLGAPPDYGGAVLKLDSNLALASVFRPDGPMWPADGRHNGREWLNRDDLDYGSGGVLLLPGDEVISGGKPGRLYLTDNKLNLLQGFQAFFNMFTTKTGNPPNGLNYPPYWDGNVYRLDDNPHLHGTPVFWRGSDPAFGYLYAWSEKDNLKAFKFYQATQKFGSSFSPVSDDVRPWAALCPATNADFICNGLISPDESVCPNDHGDHAAIMPGGMLSLSANGTAAGSGVIWASLHTFDPGNQCNTRDKLLAYDAQTLKLIWQDDFGWANNNPVNSSPKWGVPTIADGRLLVGTGNGKLLIYELPLSPPDPVRITAAQATGPVHLTWQSDDPGADGFVAQVMGGSNSPVLPPTTRSYSFNSSQTGLSTQIRLCSQMRGQSSCNAWSTPVNTQAQAYFDVARVELNQTGWTFSEINSVSAAQAARAAFAFCTNNGFVGGQFNGYEALDDTKTITLAGVVCDGSTTSHFYDSTVAERQTSAWKFADINTVPWAQASRLAADYCTARGFTGGQFNGNELNGNMGIVCYKGTLLDLPKSELDLASADLNLLPNWSAAARAANDACIRRAHSLGGRLNGWQSDTAFGAVCY